MNMNIFGIMLIFSPNRIVLTRYNPLYSPQYFNDYYSSEHARLLALWRDVVDIKRSFTAMQSATEQDLGKIRAELGQSTRQMNGACNNLVAMGAGSSVSNGVSVEY